MSSEAIERASEIVDRIPSASRHRGPRVDVPEEKERDCSNCGEQMRGVVVEGVAIDVCPQCRGVWLDRGEFDVVWQWFGMPLDEEASGQRQKSDGDAIASETLMTLVETILVATSLFH
jgi:Zn-finger nucleic acid-binding protein